MKFKKTLAVAFAAAVLALAGCSDQSDRVSVNLARESNNFNVVRKVIVMNGVTNDIMFEMTGKMSITADTADQQLEIVVEDGDSYKKVIVGLSDNTSYIVQDVETTDVSNTAFTVNFNPEMVNFGEWKTID